MWSTPSLPSLSVPLWTGVVVPVNVPFMGQIELLSNLVRIIISYLKSYSCVQIVCIRLEYLLIVITNVKKQYLKPFILCANKCLTLIRIISF